MSDETERPGGSDLDRRLDAYEAQARAAGADSSRVARWPAYAAPVGVGLALAHPPRAGIIYTKPAVKPTVAVPAGGGGQSAPINLGGGAGSQFEIKASHFAGPSFTVRSVAIRGTNTHAALLATTHGTG